MKSRIFEKQQQLQHQLKQFARQSLDLELMLEEAKKGNGLTDQEYQDRRRYLNHQQNRITEIRVLLGKELDKDPHDQFLPIPDIDSLSAAELDICQQAQRKKIALSKNMLAFMEPVYQWVESATKSNPSFRGIFWLSKLKSRHERLDAELDAADKQEKAMTNLVKKLADRSKTLGVAGVSANFQMLSGMYQNSIDRLDRINQIQSKLVQLREKQHLMEQEITTDNSQESVQDSAGIQSIESYLPDVADTLHSRIAISKEVLRTELDQAQSRQVRKGSRKPSEELTL